MDIKRKIGIISLVVLVAVILVIYILLNYNGSKTVMYEIKSKSSEVSSASNEYTKNYNEMIHRINSTINIKSNINENSYNSGVDDKSINKEILNNNQVTDNDVILLKKYIDLMNSNNYYSELIFDDGFIHLLHVYREGKYSNEVYYIIKSFAYANIIENNNSCILEVSPNIKLISPNNELTLYKCFLGISDFQRELLSFKICLDDSKLVKTKNEIKIKEIKFDISLPSNNNQRTIDWINLKIDLTDDIIEKDLEEKMQIDTYDDKKLQLYQFSRYDAVNYISKSTIFQDVYKKYNRNLTKFQAILEFDDKLNKNLIGFNVDFLSFNTHKNIPESKINIEYEISK